MQADFGKMCMGVIGRGTTFIDVKQVQNSDFISMQENRSLLMDYLLQSPTSASNSQNRCCFPTIF